MASLLSRRLNPRLLLQNPNPSYLFPLFQSTTSKFRALSEPIPTNPIPIPLYSTTSSSKLPICPKSSRVLLLREPIPSWLASQFARQLSSAPPEKPDSGDAEGRNGTQNFEFRHQEIVGPTVERDVSALANETRQVLDGLRKSTYDLSTALALLGMANLGLGAWIVFAVRPPEEVLIQGLAAFAFPFSLAFLMRQALKPMTFFRKMEEQGRLQILTLALQVTKSVNLLLLRTRVVAFCCTIGVTFGTVAVLWFR